MIPQHTTKQLDDFRNLKPYYDLVFEIMGSISQHAFERDLIKLTRSVRELVINTAPYILDPKKKLDQIDEKLTQVFTKDYFLTKPNKAQQEKIEELKDDYITYIQELRVSLMADLEKSGFMPKTQTKIGRKVNKILMREDEQ